MAVRYKVVARITKAHGNKGKVVAVPTAGLPFVIRQGMRIAVVPPELKGERFCEVLSAENGETGQLLTLSGSTNRANSEAMVGKRVLVEANDLPDDLALHDISALLGREVVDESLGLRGIIAEVMQGPANDVWAIETNRGELLLPVHDEVVGEVLAEGPIEVHVPAGLEPEGGE